MVTSFAQDTNPHLSPDQVAYIGDQATKGDITFVMEKFEQEIKSPIKNIVMGIF